MSGAWAGSTRRRRLPAGWDRIRSRVLTRDRHTCRSCGAPASHVDHIVAGDNHHPDNLQALCATCHQAKSAREGTAAAAARPRARDRRPVEPHPGILP